MVEKIRIELERDGQIVVNRQIQNAKIEALDAAVSDIYRREEGNNSTPGVWLLRYIESHLKGIETNYRRDEAQRAQEPDDELIGDVP